MGSNDSYINLLEKFENSFKTCIQLFIDAETLTENDIEHTLENLIDDAKRLEAFLICHRFQTIDHQDTEYIKNEIIKKNEVIFKHKENLKNWKRILDSFKTNDINTSDNNLTLSNLLSKNSNSLSLYNYPSVNQHQPSRPPSISPNKFASTSPYSHPNKPQNFPAKIPKHLSPVGPRLKSPINTEYQFNPYRQPGHPPIKLEPASPFMNSSQQSFDQSSFPNIPSNQYSTPPS